MTSRCLKINRMVIACTNSEGDSDFTFVNVRCTKEQLDEHKDYDAAEKWASENDFERPFVVFNCEVDTAGKSIVENFKWETASVVDV